MYYNFAYNQQIASEFHTKTTQQCTNIYNSCFEVMHILTLFSVGIMSLVFVGVMKRHSSG